METNESQTDKDPRGHPLDTQNLAVTTLTDPDAAFDACFIAAGSLKDLALSRPNIFRPRTLEVVEGVLIDSRLSGYRQSLCLFREATEILCALYTDGGESPMANASLSIMKRMIATTQGPVHRAVCETLGNLPAMIPSAGFIEPPFPARVQKISWAELLRRAGVNSAFQTMQKGRSLIMPIAPEQGSSVLVIKSAFDVNAARGLNREAAWMEYLAKNIFANHDNFDIPLPLKNKAGYLFSLIDPPPEMVSQNHNYGVIAFLASATYFQYPNEAAGPQLVSQDYLPKIMGHNAWLLGTLASHGIIHSAPIPLFHNRVQSHRRDDQGVYDWPLAGRLDRWLDSCRYPNLAQSGLRDFEHLEKLENIDRSLYWHLGSHFLSLLLLTGSCFRGYPENTRRRGDYRSQFDPSLLKATVNEIFAKYFSGFTGRNFTGPFPGNVDHLVGRMIEEMGTDNHMEEVLRTIDQESMTAVEFNAFLSERGMSHNKISSLIKGREDIILNTGPHLGEFNGRISLPEIIVAAAAMSATCITGRHTSAHSN